MDRITTHTCTVTEFLNRNPEPISRFVLLDHMDWLSTFGHQLLQEEWQAIVDHAAPESRIIWRSGGINIDYVDPVKVRIGGAVGGWGICLATAGNWLRNCINETGCIPTAAFILPTSRPPKGVDMTVIQDIHTLYRMVLAPIRGTTHAQRLESFYGAQAHGYDTFRQRLLQGRRELIEKLNLSPGEIWLDMGAGTGANLDVVAHRVPELRQVTLVDLCPSLLAVAEERIAANRWSNVDTIRADVAKFKPSHQADVITFPIL